MSFSLLVVLGLPVLLLLLPLMIKSAKAGKLSQYLSSFDWFHTPYACGLLVFGGNLLIFGMIVLIYVSVVSIYPLPLVPLLALLGVLASIWFWLQAGLAWKGPAASRVLMSAIGSSFYWLLLLWCGYKYGTLSPQFEGDDIFMAAIGLIIGMIITGIAALTCMFILLISAKIQNKLQ